MRDLFNHINPITAIPPQSVADNTALVSSIIDLKGFNALCFAILLGSLGDADAAFTVLLEHGDASNLSDAAAVPDDDLNGTEALAGFIFSDDNKTRKLGYVGSKRYVRLTITPAGNATAALIGATAILGHAALSPPPNPPA